MSQTGGTETQRGGCLRQEMVVAGDGLWQWERRCAQLCQLLKREYHRGVVHDGLWVRKNGGGWSKNDASIYGL